MEKCQGKLANGQPCTEELIPTEDMMGKNEPPIHHAEGDETTGVYSHHSCRLGHAWHRHMGGGLITPCDCTGNARRF